MVTFFPIQNTNIIKPNRLISTNTNKSNMTKILIPLLPFVPPGQALHSYIPDPLIPSLSFLPLRSHTCQGIMKE